MAVRTVLEEKIRLYVESAGDDELKALVAQLGDLGDTADFQSNIARKAMERFAQAIDDIARVDAFEKLKRELVQTEQNLDQARKGAQELFREFKAGDGSSSAITRAQRTASKTVNELSEAAQRQRLQLQRLRGELSASGIDTRRLGTAQGDLKQRMAEARATLASSAKSVQQFRAESARAAREIPAGNAKVAASYGKIGGALSRLRSLAAPVLAFLTFRSAGQGIKALADVAKEAENARRSLSELYGTQAAGNAAYDALRTMAERNGIAFADLVRQAQRLKAFGLDPLNGSLQALVDQNAAVGGSSDDLAGKVLALGQAWTKQKLMGQEVLQFAERGVPVWDLLSKATGKNVQELQKLGEQGKLGRNTIRLLYEEIGKANSGAAERALGSLSGLMAQLSARWRNFKQAVVDAGLAEYMKRQFTELLSATGGFDALAKKVSDGVIGVINGLKSLGQQILPLAKSIGDATAFVARHTDAVLALAAAYVTLKLAQVAQGFSLVASGASAAGKATEGAARRAVAATMGINRLSIAMERIPKVVRMSLAVVGAEAALLFWSKAGEEIHKAKEAQLAYERVQIAARDLQREHLALGRQLTDLYRANAEIQLKSGEEVSQLTKEQAQDYKFALEQASRFFEGQVRLARASNDAQAEATALERWRALGSAIKDVEIQLNQLAISADANGGVNAFVNGAVAKFDELIAKGKSTKEAIKGAFDGLDLASTKGLEQASEILDQITIRGTAAGHAVQAELRAALAGVADEDLPKVKAAAAEAFDSGSQAAKDFARAVDAINLTRLGVDVDAITTGFSKAGRAAVDQFRAAITEVDRLGLTAAQRSEAIAQAFDNAFKKASTKSEIEALRKALQEALSESAIGFDEFKQRIAQADAQLAQLSGNAPSLAAGVKQGVANATEALDTLSNASTTTTTTVEKVGEAAKETGEKTAKSGEQVKQASFAMSAFGRETNEALKKLSWWAGHPLWSKMQNFIVDLWRTQRNELRAYNEELDKQLEKMDPLYEAVERLRQQYGRVSDAELRATAEKQKRINDQIKTQQEQALRDQRAAEERANAERKRAREEGADNALAKPQEVRFVFDWKAPSKSTSLNASAAELEQAERLAALVAPKVLQMIERSRSISVRGKRRW